MSPRLSIVVGFRDRELDRVERFLGSLAAQTFQDFELLFVDYGSRPGLAAAVRERVIRFPFARYLHSETHGHAWSRSRALNIGGRRARGELLATTDVDLIFDPGVTAALLRHADSNRMVYNRVHYLPRGFRSWNRLSHLASDLPRSERTGLGALCCLSTDRFREIRGFDERYLYWGIEDRDLNRRLLHLGMDEVWMDGPPVFHQWHPRRDEKTPGFLPLGVWGRSELHFLRESDQALRNGDDWGRLLTVAERPALAFLDTDRRRLLAREDLYRVDLRPYQDRDLARMLRAFWNLPSGHALAVEGIGLPQRTRTLDLLLRCVNSVIRRLGLDSEIDYRSNLIRSFLPELVLNHTDILPDHFLEPAVGGGIALLVRGRGERADHRPIQ